MAEQLFQMAKETSDIIARMKATTIGDEITYEELSALIFADVQSGRGRGYLTSARHVLLVEHQIVFGTIRNYGLKRLSDTEVVEDSSRTIPKINRACSRTMKRLTCVQDFDAMPNEAKIQHNAVLSVLGTLRMCCKKKKVEEIYKQVEHANDKLAIGQTLSIFGK